MFMLMLAKTGDDEWEMKNKNGKSRETNLNENREKTDLFSTRFVITTFNKPMRIS